MAIENFTGFNVISDVGPSANSYTSVAYAKSLWILDPYKDVGSLEDEFIAKCVISATAQINREYGKWFSGSLYDDTYALFFPRKNIADSRGVEITDMTVFPSEVADAAATQAWYVCNSNRSEESSVSVVKSQKGEGIGSIEYFSPAQQAAYARSATISEETRLIISPYIIGGNSSKYVTLMGRG